MYRAVAKFLLVEGGNLEQYEFINKNFSLGILKLRKIVLLIFKPFKMFCKLFIYIRIILESFVSC